MMFIDVWGRVLVLAYLILNMLLDIHLKIYIYIYIYLKGSFKRKNFPEKGKVSLSSGCLFETWLPWRNHSFHGQKFAWKKTQG